MNHPSIIHTLPAWPPQRWRQRLDWALFCFELALAAATWRQHWWEVLEWLYIQYSLCEFSSHPLHTGNRAPLLHYRCLLIQLRFELPSARNRGCPRATKCELLTKKRLERAQGGDGCWERISRAALSRLSRRVSPWRLLETCIFMISYRIHNCSWDGWMKSTQ